MKSAFLCLIYALFFHCGHSTFLLPLILPHQEIRKLGHYGGNASLVSMGGFSSGSMWTGHYHVAFSKEIMGVALINGSPIFCGFKANRTLLAIATCGQSYFLNRDSDLISLIEEYSDRQLIDSVEGIAGDKVFIMNCALDTFVNPLNGLQYVAIYKKFGADIKTNFYIPAAHSMITNEVKIRCPVVTPFWLTNCNYDAAYEALNHIYGNLTKPCSNTTLAGELFRFDQSDFTAPLTPFELSMADYGYVYVPSYCKNNTGCRVHVVNHGCITGGLPSYEPYVRYAGYNEVAEVNNIIVIYPQMTFRLPLPGTPGFDEIQPMNILACHDWYGYTTPLYAAKTAPQMQAFHKIIERALSNGAK